ncbi:MAG: VWA domain-containing protein [Planctomycetaceae bacterium]|jgi:Mg-chelatase subunit ChlD|nr:VWA domain-containing protein [Planctomycetaceae bacterium]
MDFVFVTLSRRACVGSILFHLFLFLVLIFLLRSQPIHKSFTEERNATGGILVKQVNNNVTQYSGTDGIEFTEPQQQFNSENEIVAGISTNFAILQPPKRNNSAANSDSNSNVKLFDGSDGTSIKNSDNGKKSNTNGSKSLHVFDTSAQGNNFVFVFDKSNSMNERGGIPFRAAKAELLRNINELSNEKCKLNIIFYNENLTQWNEKGMLETTELNCKNAARFVQAEIAQGGTKHFTPLVTAIKQKPDVIFFLTDGDDNDAMTQNELAEIKRTNKLNKVQINVIQFGMGNNNSSNFLIQLAKDNYGLYVYINIIELNQ